VHEIAVVTTSGRAYYRLVSELKRRQIAFLSLIPGEPFPLSVKVAITTEKEREDVDIANVLIYNERNEPSCVVEKATQLVQGKKRYHDVVVGVDPGKSFGLAILADGAILETGTLTSENEAAEKILDHVERLVSDRSVVKVGCGAELYRGRLLRLLKHRLPLDVSLEIVEEAKTTQNAKKSEQKGSKDALSAVEIALRNGRGVKRRDDIG
jgi:RNase H-fold protein (predicted Holliday junction resolvase)